MSTRSILEEAAETTGWNLESMFEVLCAYVDNQKASDALDDYVTQRVEEETGENDEY